MVASNQVKWSWEKQKETPGFNCNLKKREKAKAIKKKFKKKTNNT